MHNKKGLLTKKLLSFSFYIILILTHHNSETSLHDTLLATTVAYGFFSALSFGAYVDANHKANRYSNKINEKNFNHKTKTLKNHELADIEESNTKTTLESFKYFIITTSILGATTIVTKVKL